MFNFSPLIMLSKLKDRGTQAVRATNSQRRELTLTCSIQYATPKKLISHKME